MRVRLANSVFCKGRVCTAALAQVEQPKVTWAGLLRQARDPSHAILSRVTVGMLKHQLRRGRVYILRMLIIYFSRECCSLELLRLHHESDLFLQFFSKLSSGTSLWPTSQPKKNRGVRSLERVAPVSHDHSTPVCLHSEAGQVSVTADLSELAIESR